MCRKALTSSEVSLRTTASILGNFYFGYTNNHPR
jgi:hypothetical protein